ncbi:hypothetical protein EMIT0194MI4_80248 [Pseudomonas sp. IT-194MI4]
MPDKLHSKTINTDKSLMKNLTKTYISKFRINLYQVPKNLTRQLPPQNTLKHKSSTAKYHFMVF